MKTQMDAVIRVVKSWMNVNQSVSVRSDGITTIKKERKMVENVEKCNRCPARNDCILACEPGSILCMRNRMRSGKTHGDEIQEAHIRYCPHCGRPIN